MEDSYEKAVLAGYVENLLKVHRPTRRSAGKIWESIEGDVEALGLHRAAGLRPFLEDMEKGNHSSGTLARLFIDYREPLIRGLERCASRVTRVKASRLERNLRALAGELRLDEGEAAIFGLFVRYRIVNAVEKLGDELVETVGHQELVAAMLGLSPSAVFRRLRPDSRLIDLGLISSYDGYRTSEFDDMGEVPDHLLAALYDGDGTVADIHRLVLGLPAVSDLEWEDFGHLGQSRDRVERFIKHCLENRSRGVNVLLYGPPGTGKTEFAKVLGTRAGAASYMVGEGKNAFEPDRKRRLRSLRMAQALLNGRKRSLIVFDEMEDAFSALDLKFSRGSKVYTNRVLEDNPVPTIWIVNDPGDLAQAHIRRMSLALELKSPPEAARRRVLGRLLERHGCALPEEEIAEICRLEDVAPAVLASAVKFAGATGGGADDVRFAVSSIAQAISGEVRRPAEERPAPEFDLAFVNADADLGTLAGAVSRPGGPRAFSLCLYGPPGTGKTRYIRHLASLMGMGVLVRRASDILGSYVGQTEAAIARAFAEAREEEKFLVFDEADSLLADRKGAHRSWEITQVNEMLTWMECHPLPFACTTNLMDHLDQASLRRFTLKVKFDYLGREQAGAAFLHFLGVPAPAGLEGVRNLTPGDYVVVREKADIMGFAGDPDKLLDLLSAEVSLRKGQLQVKGFGG